MRSCGILGLFWQFSNFFKIFLEYLFLWGSLTPNRLHSII